MSRTRILPRRGAGPALAALMAGTAMIAVQPAASAQTYPEIEANVALTSDYRFRGVSLSDEQPAIQGGFDVDFGTGFYVGTWASSIDAVGDSEIELDFYAGYGFEVNGIEFDVGGLVYTYPGESDAHFFEVYASAGFVTGLLENEIGVAYSPDQDNLGDDNLYLYYAGSFPLGETGLSLIGGLGYETGAFGDLDGDGDDKWDWTLGVTWTALSVDWTVAYVDTSEDTSISNATAVFTISKAF